MHKVLTKKVFFSSMTLPNNNKFTYYTRGAELEFLFQKIAF